MRSRDACCPLDSDLHNAVQFTIMLLVWHLVAVVTVEATDHCAFSLLTVSSLTWSQMKKKKVSVADLMELTTEKYFLCRYTCFVLLVFCCHSTLPCNWFSWSRGGGSNIGCRCWRLVRASFYWFLRAQIGWPEKFLFFLLFFFSVSAGPNKKCINYDS